MGAWAGQPNIGGMQPQQQGGGDAPAFDLPPPPQMPTVGGSGPMPPQPTPSGDRTFRDLGVGYKPYPTTGGGDRTFQDPGIGYDPYPNSGFLKDLYRQELGRGADNGGMNYWLQQMANGMSQDQIRQMFDQSEEGQAYNQRPAPDYVTPMPEMGPPSDYFPPMPEMGPPSDYQKNPYPNRPVPPPPFAHNMGPDFTPGGRGNDLISLYQQELGRNPDSEGMSYWLQQLRNGMSMDQVQQMFDQSQEGQAYNQQPPPFLNVPMHPEIEDALRLANQRGQQSPPEGRPGGGVGGPHMEQGQQPYASQAMGILRSLGVM